MLTGLLAVGSLVLTGFDAMFTRRRMLRWGLAFEHNTLLARTARRIGLDAALFLHTVLPMLLLILGAMVLPQAAVWLGILFGIRLAVFWFQILSFAFERQLEAIAKERDSGKTTVLPPTQGPNEP